MRTKHLWIRLQLQPFPCLQKLSPADRDGFVLLDAYLRVCLEEWDASDGQLSVRMLVLLDDCVRTISRSMKQLDGEGQYYFEQFRQLARRILRGIDVSEASRLAQQEQATLFDVELLF